MHHAQHLVVRAEHRVPAVAGAHPLAHPGQGVVGVHHVDRVPGDHRVLHVPLGEVEDPVQQHRQLLRQIPALGRLGDDVLQVAGRGRVLDIVRGLDPQALQQQVRGPVEDLDEPAEHGQVTRGGAGQAQRHLVGPGDRQVLREQLTEDHLDQGGEQQGEHGADRDADAVGDADPAQRVAQRLTDQRLGHVADQQAGDGDAELGAREHERGLPGHPQRPFGGGVPGGGPGAQRRPVDRHEGELLGHEVAGDGGDRQHHQHSEKQSQEPHQVVPPFATAWFRGLG